MTAAIATKSPLRRARTSPPGTGELHRALEDARDRHQLVDFCSEYACTSNQVSADGIRLDILKCLDLFRAKYGWVTSELRRGQTQPVKGATKWLVDIELPSGPIFTMGFYSQNTP